MKKLTKRVASLLSIGSVAFLGLFHTSCDRTRGGGGGKYGPYVDYDVTAKVQTPEGKPIEGLEVTLLKRSENSEGDFVPWSRIERTNAAGLAYVHDGLSGFGGAMLYVRAVDVDGVKNGRWETKVDSVAITPSDIHKFHPETFGYQGTIKKEITLTMEPASNKKSSK
ncbi:radical SAM-associated putative lipoprotein [Porphyromonas endodontalis]|uniref:radical SAM-associated putative lipoprotein n=1 Tax=Porphyromonas endodontalis TaxID=28124 RepID=UPI0028801630|nr:radical SAM-associated putative lipoprotein [Porphyromonas endodontalis]